MICTVVNTTDVSRTFFNTGAVAFPTLNDTVVGNSHVSIFVNFAYDFGATVYYAYPDIAKPTESTIFGPQEISPVWSGQGWVFSSTNGTAGYNNLSLGFTTENTTFNLTNIVRSTDANRTQRVMN